MPALRPQWVEHDPAVEPPPQPAAQAPLPFWESEDWSDAITTSEAARILGMSGENVRVLARNGTLKFRAAGSIRLFSRQEVRRLRMARELYGLFTSQPAKSVRMPYAAYRSRAR